MFKGILLFVLGFSSFAFAQDTYRLCGHIVTVTIFTEQHVQETGMAYKIEMNGCQSLPIWNPNWNFLVSTDVIDHDLPLEIEQSVGRYTCIDYAVSDNMEYLFQYFSKVDKENKPVDPNYNCGQ